MARQRLNFLALAATGLMAGCVVQQQALEGPVLQAAARAEPAAAATLSVTAPNWRVGDRWVYSDEYGLTVTETEGGVTRFSRLDDPEQWISRRGFLRQDAQSATTKRSVVFRSIAASDAAMLRADRPLVFTREFTANGKTRVHTTSWLVEGKERVSVPAGDFESTVIVMRTRNPETGWTAFERWWYAPRVRNYVRMEYRYGEGPVSSRVLTEFEPGAARQSVETPQKDPIEPVINQVEANPANSGAENIVTPATANQGPNAIAPSGKSSGASGSSGSSSAVSASVPAELAAAEFPSPELLVEASAPRAFIAIP